MTRPVSSKILSWTMLASLAVVLVVTNRPVAGQEAQPVAEKAAGELTAPAKTKKFRGRLPNHYRKVVDEQQRKAIYKIQEEYASKAADLKAQLKALIKERDEKVVAVLTPEQVKKVQDLMAAAKAKRAKKKSAKQ